MTALITVLAALGGLCAVVIAVFAYLTLAINTSANRLDLVDAAPPIGEDPSTFLRAVHGGVGQPPCAGNAVRLHQNGDEIFPAMIEAIRAARETVHFATYVYWRGEIPDAFAALFAETARRGVKVRVVLDSEGAESMEARLVDAMRAAGCEVATFRAMRWFNWMRYNHRSHRRLLIVDGRVAFTGGVGIADEWSGDAQDPAHWRDTHARLEGPAVAGLQAAFADTWNHCTRALLLNARDYPVLAEAGTSAVAVVASTPARGTSAAQRAMAACIAGATRSLHITNAYFVPTPAFVDTLRRASRRGVDVRVIVPGPHIDMHVVRCASRHVWRPLLEAGVRIYEYEPTMIHCKTLVADGQVSLVGSINFDPRSFSLNDECALLVSDARIAAEMERVFARDLERTREVDPAALARRRLLARLRDAAAYWIRAQL